MHPIVKKALYFAAEKHDGQYRRGAKVPFLVHPILTAFAILKYTDDQEIVAAGLLHDVLEDCPEISSEMIQEEFGNRIATLVNEVSSVEKKEQQITWRQKKNIYLDKIRRASKDALVVIGADKMHNMQSYMEALKNNPDDIHLYFKEHPTEYLWYYSEIANILQNGLGDHPLVGDFVSIVESYKI